MSDVRRLRVVRVVLTPPARHKLSQRYERGVHTRESMREADGDEMDVEQLSQHTMHQGVRALANLAVGEISRARIAAGDGLAILLRCAAAKRGACVQEVTARCFVNLSFEMYISQRFVQLGGVDVLVRELLSRVDSPAILHKAILITLNLSTRLPHFRREKISICD